MCGYLWRPEEGVLSPKLELQAEESLWLWVPESQYPESSKPWAIFPVPSAWFFIRVKEHLYLGVADVFRMGPAIVLNSEMNFSGYENAVHFHTWTCLQPDRGVSPGFAFGNFRISNKGIHIWWKQNVHNAKVIASENRPWAWAEHGPPWHVFLGECNYSWHLLSSFCGVKS